MDVGVGACPCRATIPTAGLAPVPHCHCRRASAANLTSALRHRLDSVAESVCARSRCVTMRKRDLSSLALYSWAYCYVINTLIYSLINHRKLLQTVYKVILVLLPAKNAGALFCTRRIEYHFIYIIVTAVVHHY